MNSSGGICTLPAWATVCHSEFTGLPLLDMQKWAKRMWRMGGVASETRVGPQLLHSCCSVSLGGGLPCPFPPPPPLVSVTRGLQAWGAESTPPAVSPVGYGVWWASLCFAGGGSWKEAIWVLTIWRRPQSWGQSQGFWSRGHRSHFPPPVAEPRLAPADHHPWISGFPLQIEQKALFLSPLKGSERSGRQSRHWP